jgi:tRNA U34 5-carboxymethylaminomethyl modifying GTPase MnmE/TrmE
MAIRAFFAAAAATAAVVLALASPARAETISDADAQRFVTFFEKFIAIVVANQNDCPKMATGIHAHLDANAALLKQMADARAQKKQLPPAVKAKMEQKVKNELAPALQKCAQDKAVQAALARMERPRSDHPKAGEGEKD